MHLNGRFDRILERVPDGLAHGGQACRVHDIAIDPIGRPVDILQDIAHVVGRECLDLYADIQTRRRHEGLEVVQRPDRPVNLLRSEEHTSELQSLMRISYAVFCLKKKNKKLTSNRNIYYLNIKRQRKAT